MLITFQYCIGFAIHQHESVTRVPHPEPPSLLPPCTIPLGHPSAPKDGNDNPVYETAKETQMYGHLILDESSQDIH